MWFFAPLQLSRMKLLRIFIYYSKYSPCLCILFRFFFIIFCSFFFSKTSQRIQKIVFHQSFTCWHINSLQLSVKAVDVFFFFVDILCVCAFFFFGVSIHVSLCFINISNNYILISYMVCVRTISLPWNLMFVRLFVSKFSQVDFVVVVVASKKNVETFLYKIKTK